MLPPLGYSVAVDAPSDTSSPSIIQGSKGEAPCSLLKGDQQFPSSCPAHFLLHLMGQVAACGHTNARPCQGAWSCTDCLEHIKLGSPQGQAGNLLSPEKHQTDQGFVSKNGRSVINADHRPLSMSPSAPPISMTGPQPHPVRCTYCLLRVATANSDPIQRMDGVQPLSYLMCRALRCDSHSVEFHTL